MPLSEKSRAILEAIAKGHTYEQILVQELAWTYHDIFAAASEALGESGSPSAPSPSKAYSLEEIRAEHPNAYRKWDDYQDWRLSRLVQDGKSVDEMALALQRQPSAVRSRMEKLNLIEPTDHAP